LAAARKDQPMCTLLDNLLMHCGATPVSEYTLIAGGVAMVIVFLIRP
jgi:Flp pilus assembly pilin Flp